MKQKSFDCIKMKRDIHQKMLRELQGLSREERLARFERDIKSNPILSKIWKKRKQTDSESVSRKSLLVK